MNELCVVWTSSLLDRRNMIYQSGNSVRLLLPNTHQLYNRLVGEIVNMHCSGPRIWCLRLVYYGVREVQTTHY